jgi:transcriptional regulator with GAF, ATPase, and Fis domain
VLRLDLSLPEAAIRTEYPGESSRQAGDAVLTEKELTALQKKNLLAALKQANWRVSGKAGAAELLGIRPTTLNDRIRAFGIKKPH